MKTDLFQSCGHCWVFQICWHIECTTFTASSFRTWNISTGFPSPPLALFVVMLSKGHLTAHSRMSGSRWVITPSWLSGCTLLEFYFRRTDMKSLWDTGWLFTLAGFPPSLPLFFTSYLPLSFFISFPSFLPTSIPSSLPSVFLSFSLTPSLSPFLFLQYK